MDSATAVLLTFRAEPTRDECGNSWTAHGAPVVGSAHSKFGQALQLDGASYIEMSEGIELGGADFTIDFWLYTDADSQAGARAINTVPLLVQLRNPFDSSKLRLCFNKTADLSSSTVTTVDSGYDPTAELVHLAIIYSRANGFIGLFINGVLRAKNTAPPAFTRQSIKFQLGYQQGASSEYFLTGAISELRVSDGVARWIVDTAGALVKDAASSDGVKWFEPPTKTYLVESVGFDTERQLMFRRHEHATADTQRKLLSKAAFDTLRRLKYVAAERCTADAHRRLIERATASSARKVIKKERAVADTLIRYPVELKFTVPTRSGGSNNTFAEHNVTEMSISLQERTLSDRFSLSSTNAWQIGAQVNGQLLDYSFSFLIESVTESGGLKSLAGMYDQDELLYSHIFPTVRTDSNGAAYGIGSVIDVLNPLKPGEWYKATYGSAEYYVREIANFFGLEPTVMIEDFVPYQDFTGSNITYQQLITSLFGWTSRVPRRQINVFIRAGRLYCIQRGLEQSAVDITDLNHTQPRIERTLIRSLFNNPFLKGDSEEPDPEEPTEQPEIDWGEWADVDVAVPFTGTLDFSKGGNRHSLQYVKGFLRRESQDIRSISKSSSSTVEYTYQTKYPAGTHWWDIFMDRVEGDIYLTGKTERSTAEDYSSDPPTKTYTISRTEYHYKTTVRHGIFLSEEEEQIETKVYELLKASDEGYAWALTDEDSSTRRTYHVPLGNGWYGTSVTVDGVPQGSSISQGTPGNRVTPYTVNEVQKAFTNARAGRTNGGDGGSSGDDGSQGGTYEDWRRRLSPIVDTSFPVRDFNQLVELTNEVHWMNRRTRERVNVELIGSVNNGVPEQTHIIDFTERVMLDGHEYFLEANTITFTPRKLVQRLQLVRWY
ncbi:MAG: LamG domain-containing protein [Selenomonadaceae bacterium]|nr:LamG domain-containing protein [Selenomonadaceae bacterium]